MLRRPRLAVDFVIWRAAGRYPVTGRYGGFDPILENQAGF